MRIKSWSSSILKKLRTPDWSFRIKYRDDQIESQEEKILKYSLFANVLCQITIRFVICQKMSK